MHKWVMVAVIFLVACEKPPDKLQEYCLDFVRYNLKSPSTLKVIKSTKNVFDKTTFRIEYDAANAYGTPIRGEVMCVFSLKPENPNDDVPDLIGLRLNGKDYDDVEVLNATFKLNRTVEQIRQELSK